LKVSTKDSSNILFRIAAIEQTLGKVRKDFREEELRNLIWVLAMWPVIAVAGQGRAKAR
jgi:hypothetical protein